MRFYTTNSDPHTDHDNSVRTLSVYDTDTVPEDGYFHLDVSQRWGLQYEITWLYEASEPGGCDHAGGPPLTALTLLGLAALIRRR